MMKTCPACATANPETSQRCSACGGPLDLTQAATVVATTRKTSHEPTSKSDSDSSVHGRFLPGTLLAERYRIVSLAGRGGMGEVYRAEDQRIGQTVALKFLPLRLEQDPDARARLIAEVRSARAVSHPNVCRVYDVGEVDGRVFLTMEYID